MTRLERQRKLKDRLEELRDDLQANSKGGLQDWQKRRSAMLSLVAVTDFLFEDPELRGLDFGLVPLIEALSEIEKGRIPDWLSIKKDGNPGLSDRQEVLRARCAGVLQFLMDHGHQRLRAAHLILDAMPKELEEYLLPQGAHSAADPKARQRKVAEWRDKLTNHSDARYKALADTMLHAKAQLEERMPGAQADKLAAVYVAALAKHAG